MPDDERSKDSPADAEATDRQPDARGSTSGAPRSLSARDLQENEGRIDAEPGSDADQANEVPHVG